MYVIEGSALTQNPEIAKENRNLIENQTKVGQFTIIWTLKNQKEQMSYHQSNTNIVICHLLIFKQSFSKHKK